MQRVVITGLGVVAPNAIGVADFTQALKEGRSGIQFYEDLKSLNFSCCIAGKPGVTDALLGHYFSDLQLRNFNASGIAYGCIAGVDAWRDAGFELNERVDYHSGLVFGAGTSGVEKFRESVYKLDQGKVRRLGSTVVAQTMASGVSAYLGGMLGLGNQVTTNSSACATGTEALMLGFERVQSGKAKRMLVGSTNGDGAHVWGAFDAMRVMTYKFNERPTEGSRPMSATASGFVPGSGAGALVLESLESATARGAHIYAEVLGGAVNSGGQRQGGTMTAPNSEAVQRCLREAVAHADVAPEEIDLINGHLTATSKDPVEIENWALALNRQGLDFPYIQSLKSMIGHCLAAAGAIECVASVIQLHEGFIFPTVNCDDLHPEVSKYLDPSKLHNVSIDKDLRIVAKASFGFGDVNACVLFKKYS